MAAEPPLPPMFGQMVTLTCRAEVGGQRIEVRQAVVRAAYEDSGVREHIEEALRIQLGIEIVKKIKPKIWVS